MDVIIEYFLLQIVLFLPFYLHWIEEPEHVSLFQRFIIHLVVFPIWAIPFITN